MKPGAESGGVEPDEPALERPEPLAAPAHAVGQSRDRPGDRVEQAVLERWTGVDEQPDHAGTDQRDGAGYEDRRLERLLATHVVGEAGDDDADDHGEDRAAHDPDEAVEHRQAGAGCLEDRLVVVESDEALAVVIEQAEVDRPDRRNQETDDHRHRSRQQEDPEPEAFLPLDGQAAGQPVQAAQKYPQRSERDRHGEERTYELHVTPQSLDRPKTYPTSRFGRKFPSVDVEGGQGESPWPPSVRSRRRCGVSSDQLLGQLFSTLSTKVWVSPPMTHAVTSVQKVPAPTAPGIRSEASKRNTSAPSWSSDRSRVERVRRSRPDRCSCAATARCGC